MRDLQEKREVSGDGGNRTHALFPTSQNPQNAGETASDNDVFRVVMPLIVEALAQREWPNAKVTVLGPEARDESFAIVLLLCWTTVGNVVYGHLEISSLLPFAAGVRVLLVETRRLFDDLACVVYA